MDKQSKVKTITYIETEKGKENTEGIHYSQTRYTIRDQWLPTLEDYYPEIDPFEAKKRSIVM